MWRSVYMYPKKKRSIRIQTCLCHLFLASTFNNIFLAHLRSTDLHTVFLYFTRRFFLIRLTEIWRPYTPRSPLLNFCPKHYYCFLMNSTWIFSPIKNLYELFHIISHKIELFWDLPRVLIFTHDNFLQKYNIFKWTISS